MEILLAVFIFLTWVIDTFSITLKGSSLTRRYASVFVVAQAFTYITRFSVFFIMPLIGSILDGLFSFSIMPFYFTLCFLLLVHSAIFLFFNESLEARSRQLTYYFVESFPKFLVLSLLMPIKLRWNVARYKGINLGYFLSHVLLMLTFPVLLYVGGYFSDYRASLMGAISLYTGVFSLYIVFYIERRFVSIGAAERRTFANQLVMSKCLSSAVCSLIIGLLIFSGAK